MGYFLQSGSAICCGYPDLSVGSGSARLYLVEKERFPKSLELLLFSGVFNSFVSRKSQICEYSSLAIIRLYLTMVEMRSALDGASRLRSCLGCFVTASSLPSFPTFLFLHRSIMFK
jgi:hypothetical protein